jgi:predicted AAA+ superfamily ATPase
MQRQLLHQLIAWKNHRVRKPILIDGARQTGKTYLLQTLFSREFPQTLHLDFLAMPKLADAFADDLEPATLIRNLALLTGKTFNPVTDLLILDEIGECSRAVAALKYFAERAPTWFVAATGSNIGLLQSFPVGKVEQYQLRPLTFQEFLSASGNTALIEAYAEQLNSVIVHAQLFDQLTDYYFTGGMPEVVATWFALVDQPILERVSAVSQIQANLIAGYQRDFGKYAGKVDAQLIAAVFDAIPAQLAMVLDESVNRFRFNQVAPRKHRYADFANAINWLHQSRLILKNYLLTGRPQTPLAAYRKANQVKLFLFDTGLLNHQLGAHYAAIKQQNEAYKGYVAENFVQQELVAAGLEPGYSWQDARAEIEFILDNGSGQVVPVEVKSGRRTRAKSLRSYCEKCTPVQTIKLVGTTGSPASEQTQIVIPLYYAASVPGRLAKMLVA